MLFTSASVPEEELKSELRGVIIRDHSIELNQEQSEIYDFDMVIPASQIMPYKLQPGKACVIMTFYNENIPITGELLKGFLFQLFGDYQRSNPTISQRVSFGTMRNEEIEFLSDDLKSAKESAGVVAQYATEESRGSLVVVLSEEPKLVFVAVPIDDKSSNVRFINKLRGENNQSRLFSMIRDVIGNAVITLNYRLSTISAEGIETLKMAQSINAWMAAVLEGNVVLGMDYLASQYVGRNWQWRDIACSQHTKGRGRKIDPHKLVYAAQIAALAPDVTESTLREIMSEMDQQIRTLSRFEKSTTKKIETMKLDYRDLQQERESILKQQQEAKKKYLKAKTSKHTESLSNQDEVGDDREIDLTIEILEAEIDTVKKDVQYLQSVFD